MSNLYGIDSVIWCRANLDELLKWNREAQDCPTEDTITGIIVRLKCVYKKGNAEKAQDRMSEIERAFFWPAIQKAYAKRPNLRKSSTWNEGLSDIEYYLRYYRRLLDQTTIATNV
jgi:hypothetical protein